MISNWKPCTGGERRVGPSLTAKRLSVIHDEVGALTIAVNLESARALFAGMDLRPFAPDRLTMERCISLR